MIGLVFIITSSLLFVSIGWLSYKHILSQNPCKMTYSKINKNEVKVITTIKNMKLYSYRGSNDKKKSSLNKYPILFIPGANGQ